MYGDAYILRTCMHTYSRIEDLGTRALAVWLKLRLCPHGHIPAVGRPKQAVSEL